jgi:hypothetical protein
MIMKTLARYLLVFTVLLPGLAFAASADPKGDIVGSWSGTDSAGVTGGFIFKPNGRVVMNTGDQVFDETPEVYLSYEMDTTASPRRLTLNMVDKKTESVISQFHMIFEFVSKNELRLGIVNDPNKYPASFDEVNLADKMVLKRK